MKDQNGVVSIYGDTIIRKNEVNGNVVKKEVIKRLKDGITNGTFDYELKPPTLIIKRNKKILDKENEVEEEDEYSDYQSDDGESDIVEQEDPVTGPY